MKAVLIAMLALGGMAHAGEGFGELTVDQVAAKLKAKNTYFFDCNDRDSFKGAHVPGAKFVDYENVQSKDLPADKTATLIFYCMNEH